MSPHLLQHDVVLLYSADSSAYTPGQMRKQKELVERLCLGCIQRRCGLFLIKAGVHPIPCSTCDIRGDMLNISKRTLQRYRTSGELPYEMIYHKTFYLSLIHILGFIMERNSGNVPWKC